MRYVCTCTGLFPSSAKRVSGARAASKPGCATSSRTLRSLWTIAGPTSGGTGREPPDGTAAGAARSTQRRGGHCRIVVAVCEEGARPWRSYVFCDEG